MCLSNRVSSIILFGIAILIFMNKFMLRESFYDMPVYNKNNDVKCCQKQESKSEQKAEAEPETSAIRGLDDLSDFEKNLEKPWCNNNSNNNNCRNAYFPLLTRAISSGGLFPFNYKYTIYPFGEYSPSHSMYNKQKDLNTRQYETFSD